MKTQDFTCVVLVGAILLVFGWISLSPQLVAASDLRGAGVGCPCRSVSSDGCQPKQGQTCNESYTYCTGNLAGWICRHVMSGTDYVMQCTGTGCASQWKKESCSTE